MPLNLVAKIKFYILLYIIIWLLMAILLWLYLIPVWFDVILIVSCSWKNYIMLLLMFVAEKVLLLLVISLTGQVLVITQIAKIPESTLFTHRSDAKVSDRCLIAVNDIWVNVIPNFVFKREDTRRRIRKIPWVELFNTFNRYSKFYEGVAISKTYWRPLSPTNMRIETNFY